jgi:hypothetical protein
MKSRYGLAGRQSGQGTLEYILVLLIGIILILSLVYQFHSAFRSWANSFFDGYVRCLLEVGELPGTGSICQSEYETYNMANGKGLLKNNLADGGGSGKGANNASKSSSNKSSSKSGGEVMAPSKDETIGRFGQDGGRNRVTNLGAVGDKAGGAAAGKEPLDVGGSGGSFGRNSRPDRTRFEYGRGDLAEADEADKKGKPKTATAGTSNDGNALKPKKFMESLERKPAEVEDVNGNSLTFGGFIRMLFIICIIIAIVVFFGGQIMSIMKSSEKGGD